MKERTGKIWRPFTRVVLSTGALGRQARARVYGYTLGNSFLQQHSVYITDHSMHDDYIPQSVYIC